LYHLERARAMADFAQQRGCPLSGRLFEVGTGRTLNIPIGFWLVGVDEVVTTDLHRYLRAEIMRADLAYMREHEEQMRGLFGGYATFEERWQQVRACQTLQDVVDRLPIRYVAPYRSEKSNGFDGEFDFHVSCNVLEHVPSEQLGNIFRQARGLVGGKGKLLHFVDLSDHFAHSDSRLSPLHFLGLSDPEWKRLAGNPFMYQSRNRVTDYRSILDECGFKVTADRIELHRETLEGLTRGEIRTAPRFVNDAPESVAAVRYDFIAANAG
ncbi:MAG TPA: hypothetical protein VHN79_01315, partial [Lacunisphaera sp.]|nr:hypothetical protein [Lacunisphaera sp.]